MVDKAPYFHYNISITFYSLYYGWKNATRYHDSSLYRDPQGGACFYTNDCLFSGDTIFRESVGRCDLPGGNFDQIVESIEQKIFTLPDNTIIYPGHGKTTTVDWEKEHNTYM